MVAGGGGGGRQAGKVYAMYTNNWWRCREPLSLVNNYSIRIVVIHLGCD